MNAKYILFKYLISNDSLSIYYSVSQFLSLFPSLAILWNPQPNKLEKFNENIWKLMNLIKNIIYPLGEQHIL